MNLEEYKKELRTEATEVAARVRGLSEAISIASRFGGVDGPELIVHNLTELLHETLHTWARRVSDVSASIQRADRNRSLGIPDAPFPRVPVENITICHPWDESERPKIAYLVCAADIAPPDKGTALEYLVPNLQCEVIRPAIYLNKVEAYTAHEVNIGKRYPNIRCQVFELPLNPKPTN